MKEKANAQENNFIFNGFDFDLTLTKRHTIKGVSKGTRPTPSENTKEGVEKYIIHDDNHFLAITTFHYNPKYVLSYLLPLLKKEDVDYELKTIKTYPNFILTSVHFSGQMYPVIIATITPAKLVKDYQEHIKSLDLEGGKGKMLKKILKHYPECAAYHYYDDCRENLMQVRARLRQFNYHLVDAENPVFTTTEFGKALPIEYLKAPCSLAPKSCHYAASSPPRSPKSQKLYEEALSAAVTP
ncbi:hypothetical protein ACFORL_03760 [Legionella dresdenensis]|uniref:Dot/Icm T4SS effector n=1 Tax=Legionella dresdenensis TaxID=450200 RepID=A0ABV8CDG9_9GAMM